MRNADNRGLRPALAVAAAVGLVVAPSLAVGMGGGFGGFHGFSGGAHGQAAHGGFHAPAPPAIDVPAPKPPFVSAPPPVHVRSGFVQVRQGDFFHFRDDFHHHDHFHGHGAWNNGASWGWGWGWGGGDVAYGGGAAQPIYVAQHEAEPAEAPPCPELLTWSPKLGRATRQRLCD